MTALVPVEAGARGTSLLAPLTDPAGGGAMQKLRAFTAQGPVRKALPWFAVAAGVGALALTWAALSPQPQRVLYSSLSDAERADVVAALDQGAIAYAIDNNSGALTVGADDLYRARMLVASDGALAAPESGVEMLDAMPMGASRTLEGDRLRAAQERELSLTIMEIDGIEAVRVHLAQSEKSVFVNEESPPKASVMVRLARGRQLSNSQVAAIANLVAASVPGLSLDDVRLVDQQGRLLSQTDAGDADRLEMQARMEAKLRGQLDQLLAPMLGEGSFSSEIQVDLDMADVTRARESYDKEGVLRRETVTDAQTRDGQQAAGIPGATSNAPPLPPTAVPGAPQGGTALAGSAPVSAENSATRSYELGREVAVSSTGPGTLKRVSVAVAIDQARLKNAKPADLKKIEDLVAAAVGIDPARGDKVAVVVRPFAPTVVEEPPVWETPWFMAILRNVVALLAVLLVLLLGVRPMLKLIKGRAEAKLAQEDGEGADGAGSGTRLIGEGLAASPAALPDREALGRQVELAQRIVREKPDDALLALRQLLAEPPAALPEPAPAKEVAA